MSKVKWLMFPEKKPKKEGQYLVTVLDGYDPSSGKKAYVRVSLWQEKENRFFSVPDWAVVAWAKFPKPFKKEKKDEQG